MEFTKEEIRAELREEMLDSRNKEILEIVERLSEETMREKKITQLQCDDKVKWLEDRLAQQRKVYEEDIVEMRTEIYNLKNQTQER